MNYTKFFTIVGIMIVFCLLVYLLEKYKTKKNKQSMYDIDKYIIQNLKEHFLLVGLIVGGYTCKLEDDFLILYNSEGIERTRKPCIQNKNSSYFKYILEDSVKEIESEIINDYNKE